MASPGQELTPRFQSWLCGLRGKNRGGQYRVPKKTLLLESTEVLALRIPTNRFQTWRIVRRQYLKSRGTHRVLRFLDPQKSLRSITDLASLPNLQASCHYAASKNQYCT